MIEIYEKARNCRRIAHTESIGSRTNESLFRPSFSIMKLWTIFGAERENVKGAVSASDRREAQQEESSIGCRSDDETTARSLLKSNSAEKREKLGFSIEVRPFKKPISSGTEGTKSERIRVV